MPGTCKYIFILFFCFKGFISCSQPDYGIKKIYAFYIEKLPGNIPVDINGNSLYKGPDTLITIYFEMSGKGPAWDMAWRGGNSYTINTSLVSTTPYEAGTAAKDGKKVMLYPKAGFQLWKLALQKDDRVNLLPRKIKKGEILLRGKYMNTIIYKIINAPVKLTDIPRV